MSDFDSACSDLFRIAKNDAESGPFLNPITGKGVASDWGRSTLWTRYANEGWKGILASEPSGGGRTWGLVDAYESKLMQRLGDTKIPGMALAAFVYRRPTDAGGESFASVEEVEDRFIGEFDLDATARSCFDFEMPPWFELQDTELSSQEVMQIVRDHTDWGASAWPSTRESFIEGAFNSGMVERIDACAREMGMVLLYGPPGTGKTYWATKAAASVCGFDGYDQAFDAGLVTFMAWHPQIAYEDFVRGIAVAGGTISPKDGVFAKLCDRARKDKTKRNHVLVIDEINRANVAAVFGELLAALELGGRGRAVTLGDGTSLVVPPNLYVVATANTADRSIAALDAALGRRFARVEIPPMPEVLGTAVVCGVELRELLTRLNERVMRQFDRERRIGHAYFMGRDDRPLDDELEIRFALRYRVMPLVQDYAIDDFGQLRDVFGGGFVDAQEQRVIEEAFASAEAFTAALKILMESGG